VLEFSGPERDISTELWQVMTEAWERWLERGFHVNFADIDDTQVSYAVVFVLRNFRQHYFLFGKIGGPRLSFFLCRAAAA